MLDAGIVSEFWSCDVSDLSLQLSLLLDLFPGPKRSTMNNLKAYLVYKGLISARWFDLVSSMEEKSNLLWRSFLFS